MEGRGGACRKNAAFPKWNGWEGEIRKKIMIAQLPRNREVGLKRVRYHQLRRIGERRRLKDRKRKGVWEKI